MAERTEQARDEKLLGYLDSRNELIPKLIKKDQVFRPRTPLGAFLSWFITETCISPESLFIGQRYVEEVIRAYQSGASIAVASNHESDSDHGIRRFGMRKNGYGEYANKIVYLAGLKMIERPLISTLSRSENQLYIPTPMDGDALENALRFNRSEYKPEEIAKMRELFDNYHCLIGAAKAEVNKRGGPFGLLRAVYPEATRSRDGMLGNARRETASWFTNGKDGFVLPMATSGGPELLPPEAPPLLHKRFVVDRAMTTVSVGPMIPSLKLIKFTESLPLTKAGQAQLTVDCIMAHVAVLMGPDRVFPERWNHLMQVKRDFEAFCGQQRRLSVV